MHEQYEDSAGKMHQKMIINGEIAEGRKFAGFLLEQGNYQWI